MVSKLFIFFLSSLAFADCKLDQPINIGRLDLLDKGVVLKDVKFDKEPIFVEPGNYDAKKDKIDMPLFNIDHAGNKTGFLGATVEVVGKLESIGFSNYYAGNFHVKGTREEKNGEVTYVSKNSNEWTLVGGEKAEAKLDLTVKVTNGQITSVQLIAPIYTVKIKDGNSILLGFAGKHQTLCLKSAHN